jgi:hypothetical protein
MGYINYLNMTKKQSETAFQEYLETSASGAGPASYRLGMLVIRQRAEPFTNTRKNGISARCISSYHFRCAVGS